LNKKQFLLIVILTCMVLCTSYAQIIRSGTFKLYYREFRNNNEDEEFFYLKIENDNSFKLITPYVFSELPLPDGQKIQDTFNGILEVNKESIVFSFLNDGSLPYSTPYFGPPKLEVRINKIIEKDTEYYHGTISVMHVIKPFYFRLESIPSMPLQIGLGYRETKLLKTYLEFDQEIARRIKKENVGIDKIYSKIIGNSYKIDIHKNHAYWFTITFCDKKEAKIFFVSKEDGIMESTGRCKYYLYYNHDDVLEMAFRHCLPTEWGYVILGEPIFTNQEIGYSGYFIYYGGNIPSSEMKKNKTFL
jgi:hypothetical protein